MMLLALGFSFVADLVAALESPGFLASFEHGVASGDPFHDSIVLWTRATPRTANASRLDVAWVVTRAGAAVAERLRSEVNIELNFPPKLRGVRSRLYRRRSLQVNIRWN